ncbi:MAG: single-stranded-DNA-specific exonuclease RecJ [Candidatus Taylorbacteria bacterium RIFCSPHIGHO2_02_FULL_45_28]|uniref:Single-stranded-DNA-specific exonuclease RecJ n=1 Tax=Candidatus Taylorbacteria bacterium RIFCSPHIGHO2_12_FULL_45_16 TaxID=1802315 RepID=A0A1G2N127_9BACT|nr:MAG: single-stranded-DNA-specific exonuclease RecJ [Candidatus Taylorbacteria bacterium RIFCSPHIGHO2_01_FULL_44_110]OHA24980.1 MAG: single-stranded-DNA-specific exonuclease RecJ [Candidatus Taylorbacteria bacterium RIFCSPHIGHO2_02_FULL_45_28]OHA29798.1 MAG: single-stranded-DNA-specific exonuclease RecJ [Candidatus Taylorbacteria bacterium RIFCSPHIGHO2_12_FULL_45_16]OHA32742.1 MAG: single-stranded-DNA-specific exonuclease RecJ [Candidatus Taylorbacteria bacterium RIFCSPLOWO2_01_FULL_45_59]
MSYSIRRPLTLDERNRIGGASDIVAHLLFHRGIVEAEAANRFLLPDYDNHVHDPFLLKDAEKSAERIISAMKNNERIAIYSDYDADGIPAAVMFNDFFNRIGYANFSIYIPHRHNEGFGVNVEAVEQLAGEGVKLVITLDCGISDVEPVRRANELGIEVIITDHHEPPTTLPVAFAIIDHKQLDCAYPDKNLCGSGIGFKLIQAILKQAKIQDSRFKIQEKKIERNKDGEVGKTGRGVILKNGWKDGHEKWLLDMVGIATLSDMVPLIGENRVFARYGLAVLRKSPRKGLRRLLVKLNMSQAHITEDDISFMITPRINAASRMGVPMDAFKLLATDNDEDADKFATHLDEINNERKGIVAALVKEIKKIVRDRYGDKGKVQRSSEAINKEQKIKQGSMINGQVNTLPAVIVLGNPDWKPSLLGLAANSCAEEFDRPVFLWGRDGDNIIKGSCRSKGRSSVVEIMRGVSEGIFLQYGGHKHSGGFAVKNDQIHFLEKELNGALERSKEGDFDKMDMSEIDSDFIDAELKLDDITWKLQEDLDRMSPFGMGNPKPLFIFKKVQPTDVRVFGKGKDHVELVFKRNGGTDISAIAFFGGDNEWAKNLLADKNQVVDLVASIEKSIFRGRKELRLRVVEVIV